MSLLFSAMALACCVQSASGVPTLPDGARTRWVVDQPEETVCYLAFDPVTVERRLPSTLRFITIGELAEGGVRWAADHLAGHPSRGRWGISFLEIVRMGTFTIDGRAPNWPENGAAALWCARVAPSDTTADLGPGLPLLALEFWVPDSAYVAYMRGKGHYATYGDVRLHRDSEGKWRGSIDVDSLSVVAECAPVGPISGGAGSAGMQIFIPPRSSNATGVVRLAFAGHREQQCEGDSSWTIHGTHPLAGAVVLGPAVFQFGYDLVGGAYPK